MWWDSYYWVTFLPLEVLVCVFVWWGKWSGVSGLPWLLICTFYLDYAKPLEKGFIKMCVRWVISRIISLLTAYSYVTWMFFCQTHYRSTGIGKDHSLSLWTNHLYITNKWSKLIPYWSYMYNLKSNVVHLFVV